MITWSRINDDGTETVLKQCETLDEFEKYMKAQKDPEEPEPPKDGCWNCMDFDWKHEACTAGWNNMDESYYNPDTDDRELTDCCEYHDPEPDADWKEIFGGDE